MSIKTHIEIPVTLYADGDIEAGEIYAEQDAKSHEMFLCPDREHNDEY